MTINAQQVNELADAYESMAAAKTAEAAAVVDDALYEGFLRAYAAAYTTLKSALRNLTQ